MKKDTTTIETIFQLWPDATRCKMPQIFTNRSNPLC